MHFEPKMSRLPGILMKALGISTRTFERWCAKGDVPGAYRTRGGHWRVRKPSEAVMLKLLTTPHYGETRKGRITELISFIPWFESPEYPEFKRKIAAYTKDPSFRDRMMNGQKYEKAAIEVMKAALEVSDADLNDPDFAQREPEKCRLLYHTPAAQVLRDYWKASKEPCAPLMVKATMLRLNQSKVNRKNLARASCCDPRTLRKQFGENAVRKACELGSRRYDPTASTEQQPAKAKRKENLNWHHDKDDHDHD